MATSTLPAIANLNRNLIKLSPLQKPIQAWVETLSEIDTRKKLGIVNMHPRIFAVSPRLDILAKNIYWQSLYSKIVKFIRIIHRLKHIHSNKQKITG